jgi:hypothetical protein
MGFWKIPAVSPTYSNFGRLLKSCDIIFSIEVATYFPIKYRSGQIEDSLQLGAG